MRRNQIPPAPRRSDGSWQAFIRQHASQILANDFFTVETAWLKTVYVLSYIELKSRTVHLGGITAHPTGEWVVQQARHLSWKLQDGAVHARFQLRDRNAKYTAGFDQVFHSENVAVIRLPFRAPRANAIAERWVGTARRELLDHLLIFSCAHLESSSKISWTTTTTPDRIKASASAARRLPRPLSPRSKADELSATIASAVYFMSTRGLPD